MTDVAPLGNGCATRTEPGVIIATFPLSTQMNGWHLTAADVDPTGYLLTLRVEQNTDQ